MADVADEFEVFFRAELASVVAVAFRITGDIGLAEEITQDAFARALVRWRRLRRYDRPGAWVRRVAIRDAVRAARRQRPLPISGEDRAGREERGSDADLLAAVRRLPAKQRAAVVLYYLEDRPTSEVAELLGCTEATVRSQLRKAREHLFSDLRDEPEGAVGDARR